MGIIKVNIDEQYALLLRRECVKLFTDSHPESKGMKLSDRFMLQKVIDFYLED